MGLAARVLLALVAASIPVLIAEAYLRIVGSPSHDLLADGTRMRRALVDYPPAGYRGGPPGHRMTLWGHEVRFNDLGMRGPDPLVPKPEGVRRLLILGDSVAFGHGVGQQQTFDALLRERWHPLGIDVVSGAMPGWNTQDETLFFRATVDALEPDLVAVYYVINDREYSAQLSSDPPPPPTLADRIFRWLVMRSRVLEEAAFTWQKLATDHVDDTLRQVARGRLTEADRRGEGGFKESDEGWAASREALVYIRDAMRARGGDLVVYVHRYSNRKGYRFYAATLADFGLSAGVETVDTWPFFAGYRRGRLVVRRLVDPHPNALGHRLIADGIEAHLRDVGWLDGRRGQIQRATNGEPASIAPN